MARLAHPALGLSSVIQATARSTVGTRAGNSISENHTVRPAISVRSTSHARTKAMQSVSVEVPITKISVLGRTFRRMIGSARLAMLSRVQCAPSSNGR
jgi:hypothetical protein